MNIWVGFESEWVTDAQLRICVVFGTIVLRGGAAYFLRRWGADLSTARRRVRSECDPEDRGPIPRNSAGLDICETDC